MKRWSLASRCACEVRMCSYTRPAQQQLLFLANSGVGTYLEPAEAADAVDGGRSDGSGRELDVAHAARLHASQDPTFKRKPMSKSAFRSTDSGSTYMTPRCLLASRRSDRLSESGSGGCGARSGTRRRVERSANESQQQLFKKRPIEDTPDRPPAPNASSPISGPRPRYAQPRRSPS